MSTWDSKDGAQAEVDILFFDVGGERFGTDAAHVLRIDRASMDTPVNEVLGTLRSGQRVLVFPHPEGGEATLRVDTVLGVRPVSVESLRRMPLLAAAPPLVAGVCLGGDRPVLLIDLFHTLTAHGRH